MAKSRKQQTHSSTQIHQFHDKFVRKVLSDRGVAIQLLKFAVPPKVQEVIDTETLEISKDSFLDDKLRQHFSDVCYIGKTKGDKPVNLVWLFEHKSEIPESSVLEQLNRYIANIWNVDRSQQRELSLTIPVLIYHGDERMPKETPRDMFPEAPEELLRYVPSFDYILLDLGTVADEEIERTEYNLLKNILLVLKHGRNEWYIEQNWKKIIIFAGEFRNTGRHIELFRAVIMYVTQISKVFKEKIDDMENVLTSTEQAIVGTWAYDLIQEGMEKGREEGMEKGREEGFEKKTRLFVLSLIQDTTFDDEKIAKLTDTTPDFVKKIREELSKK